MISLVLYELLLLWQFHTIWIKMILNLELAENDTAFAHLIKFTKYPSKKQDIKTLTKQI